LRSAINAEAGEDGPPPPIYQKENDVSDLQSKVEALKELILWRKSGAVRFNQVETLEKEIFELAEQIRRCPITLTMDAP
jgi:hypothetical protein